MSTTAPLKRLYIKTYGCQMNVYDSERMADVLRPLGYGMTDEPEGADLVVLNTCHIREKATEKVYSELGQIKLMKARKAEAGDGVMTVAVAGCAARMSGRMWSNKIAVLSVSGWAGPSTRRCTSSVAAHSRCASAYLRWLNRVIARQYAMVSASGCSGPSTRLCTESTSW